MALDIPTAAKLKIAQILAVQIVPRREGKVPQETIDELIGIIEKTDAFRGAQITDKVKRLTIPHGVALIFTSTPDAPVRCAVQINKAVGNHQGLQIRTGIHDGPIADLTDTNEFSNPRGAGPERAIWVMECGDAGHILLTREMAGSLGFYRYWQPFLRHLGEYHVNGQRLSIVNLFTGEVGCQDVPTRLLELPVSDIPADDRVTLTGKRIALFGAVLLLFALGVTFLPRFLIRSPVVAAAETQSNISDKSIAVLPFENITGNSETASFADGIHDEILTQLAKLSDLKVISRTSVLEYKKTGPRNLREIGRQLHVAYVLEGSVQQVSDRVRVTAQLINAQTDAHVWAQAYDRVASDVLGIQTDIAKTITEQLRVELSPRERAALAQAGTTDLVAERLLREAGEKLAVGSNPDAKQAILDSIPLIEEALQRDPKYMRAYSLLVAAHLDLYWQGFDHTEARAGLAQQALRRAILADPDSGETHFAQGLYYYRVFRDYDRARTELEIARQTLPNSPNIHMILGAMDRRQGRWSEAVQNMHRTVELDPRNFRFLVEASFTHQAMRHYNEVRSLCNRALEVQPRDAFVRTQLAAIPFLENADIDVLRNTIRDILRDDPSNATGIAGAIFNYALAARNAEAATRALQAIRAEGLRDDYYNSLWPRDWFVGIAARTFGHDDEARAAFESAREIEMKNVQDQPGYAPAWSRLGLIEAMLNHKESALNAGRKACELVPLTVDAVDGASYRTNLALVYLWTGDRDSALRELAQLAKTPGGPHYGELRLYPQWDALRGDPEFEKIVASLAPSIARTSAAK